MTKASRRAKILACDLRASAKGSYAPRNNLSPQICPREVVGDPKAPYFGVEISEPSLNAGGEATRIAATHFRRPAEHLGPKLKSKNQHLELDL